MGKSWFKLVIFDLDGTLVNTLDDIADSANEVLEYFGIPKVSNRQVKYAVGCGVDNFFINLTKKPIDIEDAKKQFTKHYLKNLIKKSKLYSGMLNVLQELKKKKIHMYVVSNKPQIFSERLLELLGIKKYFRKVIGINGREKKRLKPSPYYIKEIIAQSKVKPGRAVIIGDGKTDILAGRNSGISSCAVLYGFRKYMELKKYCPDFYIKKPKDILKIIDSC
ncbi:MAG: HAD-IA family hydrolase [Elusimicrobia bacterium]|nr:HAD-IA family hydrolase [Elusimicrobiota bacterium]